MLATKLIMKKTKHNINPDQICTGQSMEQILQATCTFQYFDSVTFENQPTCDRQSHPLPSEAQISSTFTPVRPPSTDIKQLLASLSDPSSFDAKPKFVMDPHSDSQVNPHSIHKACLGD